MFLIFSVIQAATDDYLVIKSRTERNEQCYRVPNGLRKIDKDTCAFIVDSFLDESNTFSIEFFPLLQKHKEVKDGFGHVSFLLPKKQIQAFQAVLCPLSKGLLKQSSIAQLKLNYKDDGLLQEFYKETVEKDVLQSQSWNKAIVQSVQYLDSIKCNNDDLTNAFILLDFLKGSFAIKQVLINCLYDKDLIDSVIDGDDQAKTDYLKEYLLTNQLFHASKEYLSIEKIFILPECPLLQNYEMLYDLSDKALRYFNCQNITLPENSFLKTYIINLSSNKINDIAFSDFDIFDPKIKIIFDFRGNPLSLKTKKILETSFEKQYPKELVITQKKIDGSFLQSEKHISNVFLIHTFEQQIKDLDTDFVNVFLQISNLKSQAEGKKLLKTQTLSDQKFIKMCAILSSFVLFGLLLYNRKCMFIFPFCIAFFIKKFMDVVQHLKTIEIDLEKIGFDIKKNVIEQETILKIQNNIKKSVSKIVEQNQIKINRNMHNYHQNRQYYDFESSLIKNSWYILYD